MPWPAVASTKCVRRWPLVIPRLYAGVVFAAAGIGQATHSVDWAQPRQSWPDALHAQILKWAPHSTAWYRPVEAWLLPHVAILAPLIAGLHIAIGTLLILGLWTETAALIAGALLLNYMAAMGSPIYGAGDAAAYIALVIAILLGRAGRTWGVDALLATRRPGIVA